MTAKSAAAQAPASTLVSRVIRAPPLQIRGAPRIGPPRIDVGRWKIEGQQSTVNARLVRVSAGSPGREPFPLVIK
jgi:hypothetical protein